jgi:Lar family restriction alleviation protein
MNNDENKPTLEPCPFCGDDHIETNLVKESYLPVIIFCSLCGANLRADSMEDAIKRWNTRYPDKEGNLKVMSVGERIRRAIDLDFCESGKNRKLRFFISKDLFDALRRECFIPESPKDVATVAFWGHELEIVDGENRLYLARKI